MVQREAAPMCSVTIVKVGLTIRSCGIPSASPTPLQRGSSRLRVPRERNDVAGAEGPRPRARAIQGVMRRTMRTSSMFLS